MYTVAGATIGLKERTAVPDSANGILRQRAVRGKEQQRDEQKSDISSRCGHAFSS
jgi:hypothetical protein